MVLALSFLVEGFLFLATVIGENSLIDFIFACVACTTAIAVTLELVWPEVKLLRATMTLLQRTWTIHMIRVSYFPDCSEIVLFFAWHLAATFALTLCVVSVTKSFAPRMVPSNPSKTPVANF